MASTSAQVGFLSLTQESNHGCLSQQTEHLHVVDPTAGTGGTYTSYSYRSSNTQLVGFLASYGGEQGPAAPLHQHVTVLKSHVRDLITLETFGDCERKRRSHLIKTGYVTLKYGATLTGNVNILILLVPF